MRSKVLVLAMQLMLAVSLFAGEQEIPLSPARSVFPDPSDQVVWPIKGYPTFAKGSAGHLSTWLHDAPAGKHGFVKSMPDGSLQFADGTPARFWGTTTVYGMTFPDKEEEIPVLADAIAARGYNMVRFHHNDLTWGGIGFIDGKGKDNSILNETWMNRLDLFASELIKRGVYLYLDVVDSRELMENDGMFEEFPDMKGSGGGWKGLFPHPKMIETWKKAVAAILNHKNPYTGRTWGEEPALVTVEIINENGIFWDWSHKVSDSVRKWYDQEWNSWLLKKYGSREKLASAWTDVEGVCGLFPDEDPAKGNVFRPRMQALLDWDRPYRSKTRGAARINDYYIHMSEITRAFYTVATKHLRDLGFKGVIIGSHELQGPLNRYTESITGTVGSHLYARPLPAWYARPSSGGSITEGVDVKTTNWFSNIPRIKVTGCSSINGEWAAGSMMYRADANIAVAATTAFQGVDQSLHFSYGHRWKNVKLNNYDTLYDYVQWRKGIGMTFTSTNDIPWMISNRICAPLFIRGDLQKPKYTVHIAYSKEDLYEQNLHALGLSGGNGTVGNAALFLPLMHDVECNFFDEVYDGSADVVFTTGRSASGDYSKAKHVMLLGDNPYNDHMHKSRDIGKPARTVRPNTKIENLKDVSFTVEWPYAEKKTLSYSSYEGAVLLSSIPAGAQPLGKSADGKYCLGWLDDKYCVLPNGRAFSKEIQDQAWLYRLYLAAAKRWGIDTAGNNADGHIYQSDTRELTVDWGYGTLIIDTPKTQGFSGFAGWRKGNHTADMKCDLNTAYGNVLVSSCDNKPISKSDRLLLIAVGRMKNTDQKIDVKADGSAKLAKAGKGPCIVEALRGTVSIRSQAAMTVYALDLEGKRLGKVESNFAEGMTTFTLSPKWESVWFELTATDIPAPVAQVENWPATEKPREVAAEKPNLISLSEYIASTAPGKATASSQAEVKTGDMRVQLVKFGGKLPMGGYANFKMKGVKDLNEGDVLECQFGKVNNKDWCGGYWLNLKAPSGLRGDDIVAFGIRFKGDGTMPRDTYLSISMADGLKYKSKNINSMFENDAWQDVMFKPSDFTPDKKNKDKDPNAPETPDFSKLSRLDFSCIGPLMANKSMGSFAEMFLVVKRRADVMQPIKVKLPEGELDSNAIKVPYLPNAVIKADGLIDEDVWTKALPVAMDEGKVPAWHNFGSFVVSGKRANDESAYFWLLGTQKGLAVIAKVDKGGKSVTAENKNWWDNDCVEIFSDPKLEGNKPFTQLFLAYRTSSVDLASASDGQIEIGRGGLQGGYLLEAVIPWKLLGVAKPAEQAFGLEFQVDFAAPGAGRVLQMVYGTGTNEAWISAKHYLKVSLRE
ncbi:MAG: hypothetical protein JXR97_01980 [Planctomycetes bacterium]|nr:hypothetical protein [Planctomycetota bacterium]